VSLHFTEADIAPGVTECQVFVLYSHEVKHGRPEVVNGHLAVDDVIAKLIGCLVDRTSATSTTGQPHAEPERIVVAPVAAL